MIYRGFRFGRDVALLIDDADLHGGTADVNAEIILFHTVLLFAQNFSEIAFVKRAVISAGRVMAPPTTTAYAPHSMARTACSG